MTAPDLHPEPADVVIVGATPAGIVAAVRAAREGMRVTLISYFPHIGGVLSNGLSSWDTHFEGVRSVIQEEWLDLVRGHYRDTYGADSPAYEACVNGPFGGGPWKGHIMFEPHVAEAAFERLVAAESDITLVRGYHPVAVERAGRQIQAVVVASFASRERRRAAASTFVDATYEGDLAALAGVPYRVGRESRAEYDEQHAGRLFMKRSSAEEEFPLDSYEQLRYPRAARIGRLHLRPWFGVTQEIFSESTGEGDRAVQAYNHRVCLSSDPDNRRYPDPPEGYDRALFLPIVEKPDDDSGEIVPVPLKIGLVVNELRTFPGVLPMPRDKADWNVSAIPGGVDDYPDGDWPTRDAIVERHRRLALGLLYFLQNDEAVPETVRTEARRWGLARDEFTDNDNFPREIYIREARRIVGRIVFTENDARIAVGLRRAPVHSDSIAVSEWLMDSHDCTADRVPGSLGDGFTTMSEITRPAQIPYRALLPADIDNLIVAVTMSATHVGWGTVRVEPCLTHVAESVGYAMALAAASGVPVADIDIEALQRRLVDRGIMLTFFNEFDASSTEQWAPAVQYLGTKGFFADYDARPTEPLDPVTARSWARTFGALVAKDNDAVAAARLLPRTAPDGATTGARFVALLRRELEYRDIDRTALDKRAASLPGADMLDRATACRLVYDVLGAF